MNFKVSNQVLSEKQLVKYGEQLTRYREKLRKDANSTAQDSKESNEAMMVYIDKLAKKMGRGYFCKPKEKSRQNDDVSDFSIYDKKVTGKRGRLTTAKSIDIVYEVLVQHKMVKDVAKKYRVHAHRITLLVNKAKKKPKFIEEICHTRDQKE